MNEEQFYRLPVYAQRYLKNLEDKNRRLTESLKKVVEKSEETCVWHCGRDLDEDYNIYVPTNRVTVVSEDKTAGITVTSERNCVFLSWHGGKAWDMKEVAFVPSAYQQARLVSKGNMR